MSQKAGAKPIQEGSESDGEVGDAESDEERTKVANINSMDPLQWSMHRQGIVNN